MRALPECDGCAPGAGVPGTYAEEPVGKATVMGSNGERIRNLLSESWRLEDNQLRKAESQVSLP
jgi:hypothetical protein